MNYEALGRYTEAKESAEKLALGLNRKMSNVSRLCQVSGVGSVSQARSYDFVAIRAELSAAEADCAAMMAAISAANHEAPMCDREAIKLSNWQT